MSNLLKKAKTDTICLLGMPTYQEGLAQAALSPGHIVERRSDGKYQLQNTAGEDCARAIALENLLAGKVKEDAYKANENVYVGYFTPGQHALLRVAPAATAIVEGDRLAAKGDGRIEKLTGTATCIGIALEALDQSSETTEGFLRVEIL